MRICALEKSGKGEKAEFYSTRNVVKSHFLRGNALDSLDEAVVLIVSLPGNETMSKQQPDGS